MRKFASPIFFIHFFLFVCSSLHAQMRWAPIGTEWYYSYRIGFSPDEYYLKFVSEKDTIINDIQCRILQSYTEVDPILKNSTHDNIIIYEKEGILYRWIEDDFHMLYNFNLNEGDTLEIFISDLIYTNDPFAYLIIDSIRSFQFESELFVGQFLRPIDKGQSGYAVQFGGWVYEKMGSERFFIPINQLLCDDACPDILRCYRDASGLKLNFTSKPCDAIVQLKSSIQIIDHEMNIEIYPNPLSSGQNGIWVVSTLDEQTKNAQIQIFDHSGRIVLSRPFSGKEMIGSETFLRSGVYRVILSYPRSTPIVKSIIVLSP